jgi:N-acetylmuramoyl-L-alanine amidase
VRGTSLPKRVMLSPNVEPRKNQRTVDALILHYTGMDDSERACEWLCNTQSGVSCHYLVDEQGGITQMVDEDLRAWHAGVSHWKGETDINSCSIGIEIQNAGHSGGLPEFPTAQMETVIALSQDIVLRHRISAKRVLAHSDVAPGRKVDPGEKFDWAMLHRGGIGHWVPSEPISGGTFLQEGDSGDAVLALQKMLSMYGYGLALSGAFDRQTRIVVEAFQRHFRQARVDGVADPSTVGTLHKLLTTPELVT